MIGFSTVAVLLVLLYYAAPEWVATSGLSLERRLAGLTPGAVRTEQADFAYLSGGVSFGDKAPLLLIHGLGGDKDNYTRPLQIPDGSLPSGDSGSAGIRRIHPGCDCQLWDRIPGKAAQGVCRKYGAHFLSSAGHSMGGAIAGAYAYAIRTRSEAFC